MMAVKNTHEEYLPRFATCRDVGHLWKYFKWRGWHRELVCDSCDTKRIDTMDAKGRITNRRYIYPLGYHYRRTPRVILDLRAMLRKEARKLDRWVGAKGSHLKLVHQRA